MLKFIYTFSLYVFLSLFILSCKGDETIAQVNIERAFPSLSFQNPVEIQTPNDGTNRLFVVSQLGKIFVFENNNDVKSAKTFLDITDRVLFGGEQGLLGLAFHPNYNSNGVFFLNYTTSNPRRTLISKFTVSNNPDSAIKNSEEILLEVEQPYSNHNGGQLAFGPDGYLYISFGDGGSGGDPENRSQNLTTLLGSIARIDVNNGANGKKYSIPSDNPFKDNSDGSLEEIYAYGLRNPWRFSFDSTGKLWAADVGQGEWEEIDIIENGGNYGWRIMEGNHCYNPISNCNQDGLTLPVWEYGHNSEGGYSITGGYVYEGENNNELKNKYIYADYVSGNMWAFDLSNSENTFITKFSGNISSFGVDEEKNLFFADYQGGIYKIISDNVNSVKSEIPNRVELLQNYPNPFNPNTVINYTVSNAASGFIKLKVYDVLGKEIKTLVSEIKKPGSYSVNFNASELSAGIYFYTLITDNFIQTKKMTLLN